MELNKSSEQEELNNNSSDQVGDALLKAFVSSLVRNNFIEMIKRKDIKSISELLNDDKQMRTLIHSLGETNELVNNPAHMEQLLECMREIISDILDAIRDTSSDYEVEITKDGLNAHVENFSKEQKFKLKLNKKSYEFEMTSNIGEVKRRIGGGKNLIATYSEYSYPCEPRKILSKKTLDDHGFVIEQTTQTSSKNNQSKSTLRRKGLKIISDSDQTISWNGKPLDLNSKSASSTELSGNMFLTIVRYPETREYYESIIGKKLVDQIMKIYEQRQKS